MLKTITCGIALAATALAAAPAAADSRVVRYDDLNLASEAGMKKLEQRINSAARAVCGSGHDYRQSLALQAGTKKCIAEARSRAFSDFAARTNDGARGG
jgi:UrcA family protein